MSEGVPKSCPFCHEYPEVQPWHGGGPRKHIVRCRSEDCMAWPSVIGSTKRWAIANWNYRPGKGMKRYG